MAAFDLLEEEEAFDPALRSNGAVVRRDDGLRLHVRRDSPEYFFEQGLFEREQAEPGLLMRKDRADGCLISVTITAVALGLVVLYRLLIS